jgi:GMP synthase (glutamine-hydrolysing)
MVENVMKNLVDIRVLLMQIRLDQETLNEELEAFAEYSGLHVEQIDTLNVFTTPSFEYTAVNEYDALFVGGSSDEGDALIIPDKPLFAVNSMHMIRHAYEEKIPVFASCYGFQAAVVALGGELVHDVARAEKGTLEIRVTEAGKEDRLFADTPESFYAVSVHEKLAAWLPKGAVTLAESDLCPHHAFTFPDRPFYAFQFHPEVDLDELGVRLKRYQDRYLDSEISYHEIMDTAEDTSHANILLGKFMERVVLA